MQLDLEIINLLKTGDSDSVGKYYLKRANEKILQNDFRNAYEEILAGFEFLTCDCMLGNWILKELNTAVNQGKSSDCEEHQWSLVQAYAYWLSKEFETALNCINNFITLKNEEEIGYYLKGRIYSGMDKFNDALEFYAKALSIKRTNKALYRIGRIKEEYLNENGLEELYEASLDNVISHCSGRLADYSVKRGIFLPNDSSFFTNSFNDSGSLFFVYCNRTEQNIILKNGDELNFLQEKFKFLNSLVDNKKLFFKNKN